MSRLMLTVLAVALCSCLIAPQFASAQYPSHQLNVWYHYPYQYFPHNYWPTMGPRWPEQPGMPYMRAPAYQALPPFLQPTWRYEFWSHQRFHRGFHFWLDQF